MYTYTRRIRFTIRIYNFILTISFLNLRKKERYLTEFFEYLFLSNLIRKLVLNYSCRHCYRLFRISLSISARISETRISFQLSEIFGDFARPFKLFLIVFESPEVSCNVSNGHYDHLNYNSFCQTYIIALKKKSKHVIFAGK